MRIIRHQTMYQLTFMPRIFPVNCYLIEEEKELTLIDAALPYSYKGIIAAAEQIRKPITRILLTHGHEDHVGALDKLKQALPNAIVHISRRDSRLLAGDTSLDQEEPQTPIRGGIPKSIKTTADLYVQDGDEIGSLRAISTPGHTPGSMSYLDSRNRILIAGDAFQTRGGIAVSGQIRIWFPFPAWATWNKEIALESARKLNDLKPSVLAVGHGKIITNPMSEIERAITVAEQNLFNKQSKGEGYVSKSRS